MSDTIKLRATDAEDLAVFAAVLQDAVVPIEEMAYLPDERRFVMVANRFRWESANGPHVKGRIYERVHAGLCIDEVRAVKLRNIDRSRKDAILSLLTIEPSDGAIEILFSGNAAIRVEVDRILCHLEDMAEPYPTRWRPSHPVEGAG
jgi:hypothetical protein